MVFDDRRESIIRARSAKEPGGMISSSEAQRRIASESEGVAFKASALVSTASSTSVSTPPPTPKPEPVPVKMPSRDVVDLTDPGIDKSTIQNLLFENIGATELTQFVRHDTVEGINPYYNIISNLSSIKRRYDPSSLISLQKAETSYFDVYSIKLNSKIPDSNYLSSNGLTDYVYIDSDGSLVIELVNLNDDEIIEVQIDTNGTIYEIEEL
jgi:hypothetical protein